MAEIDTKRIRVGPATQQYVDSCLWLVERAREAHGEARQALEEAALVSRAAGLALGAVDAWAEAPGQEERARLALLVEGAVGRALASVLAAELVVQDAAVYLRHMNGNAENSREAVGGRKLNGRGGLNGSGALPR